ncbi:MAG: hypothetical protein ACRELE_07840, partial [Gemmatimonadales bacterium]
TFHYDPSGNRLSVAHYLTSGHTQRFNYPGASNRPSTSVDSAWPLHANTTTTYRYDLTGARTLDSFPNGQSYHYDAAGRMAGTATIFPTGGFPTADTLRNPNSCHYDPDGRLIAGCGVTSISFVGQNVVREHNGDWWYVVGPSLDNPVLVIKRGFSGMANATQAVLPVVTSFRTIRTGARTRLGKLCTM